MRVWLRNGKIKEVCKLSRGEVDLSDGKLLRSDVDSAQLRLPPSCHSFQLHPSAIVRVNLSVLGS